MRILIFLVLGMLSISVACETSEQTGGQTTTDSTSAMGDSINIKQCVRGIRIVCMKNGQLVERFFVLSTTEFEKSKTCNDSVEPQSQEETINQLREAGYIVEETRNGCFRVISSEEGTDNEICGFQQGGISLLVVDTVIHDDELNLMRAFAIPGNKDNLIRVLNLQSVFTPVVTR